MESRELFLGENVYDSSDDHTSINKSGISNVHKYLLNNNNNNIK